MIHGFITAFFILQLIIVLGWLSNLLNDKIQRTSDGQFAPLDTRFTPSLSTNKDLPTLITSEVNSIIDDKKSKAKSRKRNKKVKKESQELDTKEVYNCNENCQKNIEKIENLTTENSNSTVKGFSLPNLLKQDKKQTENQSKVDPNQNSGNGQSSSLAYPLPKPVRKAMRSYVKLKAKRKELLKKIASNAGELIMNIQPMDPSFKVRIQDERIFRQRKGFGATRLRTIYEYDNSILI